MVCLIFLPSFMTNRQVAFEILHDECRKNVISSNFTEITTLKVFILTLLEGQGKFFWLLTPLGDIFNSSYKIPPLFNFLVIVATWLEWMIQKKTQLESWFAKSIGILFTFLIRVFLYFSKLPICEDLDVYYYGYHKVDLLFSKPDNVNRTRSNENRNRTQSNNCDSIVERNRTQSNGRFLGNIRLRSIGILHSIAFDWLSTFDWFDWLSTLDWFNWI